MTTTAPTETDIADAYFTALALATRIASRRGGGDELAESLRDAATDGVLKAIEKFRPEGRAAFVTFALSVVRVFMRERYGKFRRRKRLRVVPFINDQGEAFEPPCRGRPLAGETPMSPELNDLPGNLRSAVVLVMIEGHSQREAGRQLRVTAPVVAKRLRQAAEHLAAEGLVPPPRPLRQKRLRGGTTASVTRL